MKSILKRISELLFDLSKLTITTFVIGYFLQMDITEPAVAIYSFFFAVIILIVASVLLYNSEEK